MAKGAPPPFMKKGGGSSKGKPNPFAGKKAPPFGGKTPPMDAPAFKRGGKVK